MGLGIDPENPLYQPGGQPSATPLSVESASDGLGASTVPHSVMPSPSLLDTVAPASADLSVPADLVDLDLDISAPAPLDEVNDSVSPTTQSGDASALDLPVLEPVDTSPVLPVDEAPAAGFDLPPLEPIEPAPAAPDNSLDFDLSADAPAQPPEPVPAPAGFDLSGISLDLEPAAAPAAEPEAPADDWLNAAPEAAAFNDPMNRKFELAEEFRQIGDVDGARELLQEVLENAQDGALKTKAQTMLDTLG